MFVITGAVVLWVRTDAQGHSWLLITASGAVLQATAPRVTVPTRPRCSEAQAGAAGPGICKPEASLIIT